MNLYAVFSGALISDFEIDTSLVQGSGNSANAGCIVIAENMEDARNQVLKAIHKNSPGEDQIDVGKPTLIDMKTAGVVVLING